VKHSFYTSFTLLLLIGYFCVAGNTVELRAQERTPVSLESIAIHLEGEDVRTLPWIHKWSTRAAAICIEWYPIMDKLLETENFVPESTMNLRFRNMGGVAHATGNSIVISTNWIRPDAAGANDWGMVLHELVHVIQRYPGGGQGRGGTGLPHWVMEGLTDFIRHVYFEPEVQMRPFREGENYDGNYQISAAFFMYIVDTYDQNFISKLNEMGRNRTWTIDIFEQSTGKTATELWAEYDEKVRQPHISANTRMIPAEQFPETVRRAREFIEHVATLLREQQPTPQRQGGGGGQGQGRGGQRPQQN
jgi:hypothetical protein